MRWRVARRAGVALAALVVAIPATPAAADTTGTIAYAVTGIGPSGRTVAIEFEYGGCDETPVVSVRETRASVRITVKVTNTSGPGIACPAIARIAHEHVHLASPLAGRPILGWTLRLASLTPLPARCGSSRAPVPRVVQMTAGDAGSLLTAARFSARPSAASGEVLAQHPAAGTCAAAHAVVRLTVRPRG